MKTPNKSKDVPRRSLRGMVVRVGDYVKIRDERGWWRVDGKRRGWLRLAQERSREEDQISALESTVTMVAHNADVSDPRRA